MTPEPVLLDTFCKAGGATRGYQQAGFYVVGVDIEPQPNYCGDEFVQMDALEALRMLVDRDARGVGFGWMDYVVAGHASPPCQDYSVTSSLHTVEYPRLIGPVRDLFIAAGVPYVIENVSGARADMRNPTLLCGSSFGLGVRRHRLFETSWPVLWAPQCAHYLQPEPIDVTGTGGPAARARGGNGGAHRKPRNLAHARDVMGIDWMSRRELSEAIPPPYTQFLGEQLIQHLASVAA